MYGLTQISLLAVDRELATNRKTLFILVTVPPAHQKPKIEVGFFAFFSSGTPTRIFSYCRGRVLISENLIMRLSSARSIGTHRSPVAAVRRQSSRVPQPVVDDDDDDDAVPAATTTSPIP